MMNNAIIRTSFRVHVTTRYIIRWHKYISMIPGRIPESIFPNALFPEYYNTEKVIPESQFPNAFIPN